jgi:hypothetical protein
VLAPIAAAVFSAVALAHGGTPIAPPPPAPGSWQELGRTVTSRPGKLARFYRLATNPTAVGVVAYSSSNKPIRLTWFAYCEVQDDDGPTSENQGTVTNSHQVIAYPPLLNGATVCTISVTIRVAGGRASSAIYDY